MASLFFSLIAIIACHATSSSSSSSSSAFAFTVQPLSLSLTSQNYAVYPTATQRCGPKLSIETPACTVLEKRAGYELRRYPDGQMWAETVVENATFKESTRTGFYRCYYFISGRNSKQEKIKMTGPVLIKPTPEKNGYTISFFIPSRFKDITDVPTPLDPSVKITIAKGRVHAVYGPFGGFPNDVVYKQKWGRLKAYLNKDKVKFDEQTVAYAGYTSPFQYYNRKQEVHVDILTDSVVQIE